MVKNKKSSLFLDSAFQMLLKLRKKSPIIHNITNQVAAQRIADILLALGASPLMADEYLEMDDISNISNVLSVNIGTLHHRQLTSSFQAIKAFQASGKPWVLDPVGVGISQFRRQACAELIALHPSIIRGNASEILALAGEKVKTASIDSKNQVQEAHHAAQILAETAHSVIVVSGARDYITDGTHIAENKNGHPFMARITGTGCALSAVMAAFLSELPAFQAAEAALLIYNIAGEIGAHSASGPGSFAPLFLDALATIRLEQLYQHYSDSNHHDG